MYRRCTFCTADLGENEVVEAFPVGRRLAFDAVRGRLWVICRACERWNLTPLEERWEAVEEAERLFHICRLRASTGQIGLARHLEGLDLVRIGEPSRPEFAAWRYGDRFGQRRRRHLRHAILATGAGGAIGFGLYAVAGTLLGLQMVQQLFSAVMGAHGALAIAARVPLEDGRVLHLRQRHLNPTRVRAGPGRGSEAAGSDPDAPWHVRVHHREGRTILTGQDAVRALRQILPLVNRTGASGRQTRAATAELEAAGGPEPFFTTLEERTRLSASHRGVSGLPRAFRLALEMAAHEDSERVALEGDLAWLERAWREAEEIAAIADALALPDRVQDQLAELRARFGRPRREAGEP